MNLLSTLSNNIRQFPKLAIATAVIGIAEWALTAATWSVRAANIEAAGTVVLAFAAYAIVTSNPLWFTRARAAADGLLAVGRNLFAPEPVPEEGDFIAEEDDFEDEWEEDVCPECQLPHDDHDPECPLNSEPEEIDPREDALSQVEDLESEGIPCDRCSELYGKVTAGCSGCEAMNAGDAIEAEEQTGNAPADESPAKAEGEPQ